MHCVWHSKATRPNNDILSLLAHSYRSYSHRPSEAMFSYFMALSNCSVMNRCRVLRDFHVTGIGLVGRRAMGAASLTSRTCHRTVFILLRGNYTTRRLSLFYSILRWSFVQIGIHLHFCIILLCIVGHKRLDLQRHIPHRYTTTPKEDPAWSTSACFRP